MLQNQHSLKDVKFFFQILKHSQLQIADNYTLSIQMAHSKLTHTNYSQIQKLSIFLTIQAHITPTLGGRNDELL